MKTDIMQLVGAELERLNHEATHTTSPMRLSAHLRAYPPSFPRAVYEDPEAEPFEPHVTLGFTLGE